MSAGGFPPPLGAHAALLVMDVQAGFDDGSWGERNNPTAEATIAGLLTLWRRARRTVVHVHHASRSQQGSFHPTSPGHRVKVEALPLPKERVYVKEVNSAFIGTTLERDLRASQIDTLVIVGLTTPHCISTSARMAGNLGFNTYVVADATAAFEGRFVNGEHRSPESIHAAALADLNYEFARIVSSEELAAVI